jgi:carbon-monoxide dehydrogenase medium subunit
LPERLFIAGSLSDALDALGELGTSGAPLAGGTWVMRAPIRHDALKPSYVALSRIPDLTRIDFLDGAVEIGAAVTHAALADALSNRPDLRVLAEAAGRAANPATRALATVGGNLCAADFAAADFVPALLCLGATVEIAARDGTERIDLERFLAARSALQPGTLLTKVLVPRADIRTAHARLPLRKAGDYPVAIVSLAARLDAGDGIGAIRIAVGSVEPVARRWRRLEDALLGRRLDPAGAADVAAEYADCFVGRDGVEAPGWYRISVLPALVRRAAAMALAA